MPENPELNYRKLIESEIKTLGIQGDTKDKLLAESPDILRLALESKDGEEFVSRLTIKSRLLHGHSAAFEFNYDHVVDYLVQRARVNKEPVLADFRSRIGKTIGTPPESHNLTHGSVMAIQAETLHGKPVFAIREVSTDKVTSSDEAESWVDDKVGSGYQFVFILSNQGWKLLATDLGIPFSQHEILSFFSNDLLSSLFLSHRPAVRKNMPKG